MERMARPLPQSTILRLLMVGGGVACVAALVRLRRARRQLLSHSHYCYLQTCHRVRLRLTPPRHSKFRVVALLLLDNGTEILGTNDEASPSIAGAICAERAALLQHRLHHSSQPIISIYIVTDHPTLPITPGCLCREYLYGYPALSPTKTPIVLQTSDPTSAPVVWTVKDLYPWASPTARMDPDTHAAFVRDLVADNTSAASDTSSVTTIPGYGSYSNNDIPPRLLTSAYHAATLLDARHDAVYPIRYAAAGYSSKSDTIRTATQAVALEYGCTQDAVCRLLAQYTDDDRPDIIVQVDGYGMVHAPFALARSLLVEHYGHRGVRIVVYDPNDKCLELVTPEVLVPSVPNIVF